MTPADVTRSLFDTADSAATLLGYLAVPLVLYHGLKLYAQYRGAKKWWKHAGELNARKGI